MKIKQNPKENAAQLKLTKLSNQRPIREIRSWDDSSQNIKNQSRPQKLLKQEGSAQQQKYNHCIT